MDRYCHILVILTWCCLNGVTSGGCHSHSYLLIYTLTDELFLSSFSAVHTLFLDNHLSTTHSTNRLTNILPNTSQQTAIERTFLAYHRTALVFALAATSVAQLFVLNHKANPNPSFGFYVLGKPLAVALVSLSLGLTLLGWWRWYTWQRNTIRGVCIVGGWELEGILFVMMSVGYFHPCRTNKERR